MDYLILDQLDEWPGDRGCQRLLEECQGERGEVEIRTCPVCLIRWQALVEWTRRACPVCVGSEEEYLKLKARWDEIRAQPPAPESIIKEWEERGARIRRQIRLEQDKEWAKEQKAKDKMTPELQAEIDRYEHLSTKARKALGLKNPRIKKRSAAENYAIDEVYAGNEQDQMERRIQEQEEWEKAWALPKPAWQRDPYAECDGFDGIGEEDVPF